MHVKKLSEACRRVGVPDTRRIACPLLPRIFGDSEFVIRQALADELGPFCLFLHEVWAMSLHMTEPVYFYICWYHLKCTRVLTLLRCSV